MICFMNDMTLKYISNRKKNSMKMHLKIIIGNILQIMQMQVVRGEPHSH